MLAISSIKNVQSTINNINFKAGVRINAGSEAVNRTADLAHEGHFGTDLVMTFGSSVLADVLFNRQKSIEKGLEKESQKFNAIA